jgi:hypothetical protein
MMWRSRVIVLSALTLLGVARGADVPALATGEADKALRAALKAFEGGGLTFTLRSEGVTTPLFTLGGGIPFNPDSGSRTLIRKGGVREIQVNATGKALPLQSVWIAETARLLGLEEPIFVSSPRAVTEADRKALKERFFTGADLNGDGKIDLTDLGILAGSYGKVAPGQRGDLNTDGKVDAVDIKLFQELYKFE